MLRFGINHLITHNGTRSLITSTTESVRWTVKQSGLKSVLAQKIIGHQRQAREFHANREIKIIGNKTVSRLQDGILGSRTFATKTLSQDSKEGTASRGSSNQDLVDPTMNHRAIIADLEATFSRFENRCQQTERVPEKDFVRTFDYLTRAVEKLEETDHFSNDDKVNISLLLAILIRCCGKLMFETPPKVRELLAGNVWQYIKEKKIPVDISHYNCLIRVLNENQTNFDPQTMLDEIFGANLTPDRVTYQRLIHQYCIQGAIDGATKLLEKMKDAGMPLNELTFASLITGYCKQENPPSMTELFELMNSNGVDRNATVIAAAINSQAALLPKGGAAESELKSLHKMIVDEEIHFPIHELVEILANLLPHKKNEVVAKLIDELVERAPRNDVNFTARMFGVLLDADEYERVSKIYWSMKPSERALRTGNIGVYYIKQLATHKNIPLEHCIEECLKLRDNNYNIRSFYHLYYFAALSGNLDIVRASIKKICEEEPLKCHYLWPLIAQAKDEKELVEALKNDLNPSMNSEDLLDTFVGWVWPRFSENVHRLFELNRELGYDHNLLMVSFLNYSVQENKIPEAIKFVAEAPDELVKATTDQHDVDRGEVNRASNPKRIRPNDRSLLVERLLNQIAEQTKDPALVNKAFNMCMTLGQQISTGTAQALVKVHLLNDDFKKALEVFLNMAQKHQVLPCKNNLMTYCLEKKDSESLQKIMDASTDIYGERNSLYDLAICCLRSGKFKQAQKVFSSPGFRVAPTRVYTTCRSMARNDDVSALENFVHLARDMYDINQEYLYQTLINVYERTSNGKRVLDLWNRMQEEEFQPSKTILSLIAKVLERNNIEVPFQKPRLYRHN